MEIKTEETRRVNHMSDFDAILRLTDCRGNDIGWPECDWRARFWSASKSNSYEASCIGGECRNCFNDGGRIHVVFKDHRMGVGTLQCRLTLDLPDGIYPDGIRRDVSPAPLGVELVNGAGDCPTTAEIEMLLPFIKGDQGEKMTYADLTEDDKKDLISPLTAALDDYATTEDLDVAKRAVFIDQWNTACGIWGQYNEQTGYFELNGLLDITYEEALRIMAYGAIDRYDCQGMFMDYPDIRTNLPRRSVARTGYIPQGFNVVNFGGSHTLEVLNLDTRDKVDTAGFILDVRNTYNVNPQVSDYCFYFTKCTKVIGIIDLRYQTVYLTGIWSTMLKLREIWIRNLRANFTIPANNIKPECVRYMIENAINTQPITIGTDKKHYPKLTGDTSDPVVAAMSPEELKKWTDIVPLAAEKNITFARLSYQT